MVANARKQPYTVEPVSRTVANVRINVGPMGSWEQWAFLSADHHWDNPHCDRDLLRRHFEQAAERNAICIIPGDLFCAMQGKYDRRSCKSDLRPEHQTGRYLDKLVETAAEWYAPYAKHIAVIGRGNHETAITKNHETDLTERLVERLNAQTGAAVVAGGYGGWVRFMFARARQRISKRLKYFHGAGGGGPVTRGVIQTNRQAVYISDADYVVNGHTHDSWVVPIRRERLNNASEPELVTQYHIRCPSYKEEYGDGHGGWHVERWGPPKPLGGWWIRWHWDGSRGLTEDIIEAK